MMCASVTDPNGRTARSGYEARAPRTAAEFAEYYNRSEIASDNLEDIRAYKKEFVGNVQRMSMYKESVKAEHAKTAHPKSAYITSIPMQARALITRRGRILKGGIALQVVQIASVAHFLVYRLQVLTSTSPVSSSFRLLASVRCSCAFRTPLRPSSLVVVSFSCKFSSRPHEHASDPCLLAPFSSLHLRPRLRSPLCSLSVLSSCVNQELQCTILSSNPWPTPSSISQSRSSPWSSSVSSFTSSSACNNPLRSSCKLLGRSYPSSMYSLY